MYVFSVLDWLKSFYFGKCLLHYSTLSTLKWSTRKATWGNIHDLFKPKKTTCVTTPQYANSNLVQRSNKQVQLLQNPHHTCSSFYIIMFKLTPRMNIWWWNRKQNDGRQERFEGEKNKWRTKEGKIYVCTHFHSKTWQILVILTTTFPAGSSGKLIRCAGKSPEWTGIFHSWWCRSQMCQVSLRNARPKRYD